MVSIGLCPETYDTCITEAPTTGAPTTGAPTTAAPTVSAPPPAVIAGAEQAT